MFFDLHVHTSVSECSDLEIDDILKHAESRGLDGICITDHDTMAGARRIKEGVQNNGLCIIFGMEYTTNDGDFLIFGPFEHIPLGLSATHLLELVNKRGGAAVAAHPFRNNRPVREYVIHNELCQIVESINGRNTPPDNMKVAVWTEQYPLTETGGSDAHNLDELGRVVTRFEMSVRSRADLIYALKNDLCAPQWNISDSFFANRKNAV